MSEILFAVVIILLLVVVVLHVAALFRKDHASLLPVEQLLQSVERTCERTDATVRKDMADLRAEASEASRQSQQELSRLLNATEYSLTKQLANLARATDERMSVLWGAVEQRLEQMQADSALRLDQLQKESLASKQCVREELAAPLKSLAEAIHKPNGNGASWPQSQFAEFEERMSHLGELTEQKLEHTRSSVAESLTTFRRDNRSNLEQMRQNADARLDWLFQEGLANVQSVREEFAESLNSLTAVIRETDGDWAEWQQSQLAEFEARTNRFGEISEQRLEATRTIVAEMLAAFQQDIRSSLGQLHQDTETRFHALRQDALASAQNAREELSGSLKSLTEVIHKTDGDWTASQQSQFASLDTRLSRLGEVGEQRFEATRTAVAEMLATFQQDIRSSLERMRQDAETRFDRLQKETLASAQNVHEELTGSLRSLAEVIHTTGSDWTSSLESHFASFEASLNRLGELTEQKLESTRAVAGETLAKYQQDNRSNLDQMRQDAEVRFDRLQKEALASVQTAREELTGALMSLTEVIHKANDDGPAWQQSQFAEFETRLNRLGELAEQNLANTRTIVAETLARFQQDSRSKLDQMDQDAEARFDQLQKEALASVQTAREELAQALTSLLEAIHKTDTDLKSQQASQFATLDTRLNRLGEVTEQKLDATRTTVAESLGRFQEEYRSDPDLARQEAENRAAAMRQRTLVLRKPQNGLRQVNRAISEPNQAAADELPQPLPDGQLRTIIAGSRTVSEFATVVEAIRASGFKIAEVISGTLPGVEQSGEAWAAENNVPVRRIPPDWRRDGRTANWTRNNKMAEHADALIAIWDGASPTTGHLIEVAKTRGLKVHVHRVELDDEDD